MGSLMNHFNTGDCGAYGKMTKAEENRDLLNYFGGERTTHSIIYKIGNNTVIFRKLGDKDNFTVMFYYFY